MKTTNRHRFARRACHAAWIVAFVLLPSTGTLGQSEEVLVKTVIDEAYFPSPRAAGLSGAMSPLADDIDALTYNPAGIGGRPAAGERKSSLRKVYFPIIGVSANENFRDLNTKLRSEGGYRDATVGKAIVDAAAGKRQYGRAAIGLGLGLRRFLVVPFSDTQVAAVSQGENGQVDARYRSVNGISYGFSVTDERGLVSLGYSGATVSGSETLRSFTYPEIVDTQQRKAALADAARSFSATTHNVGVSLGIPHKLRPSLAVVVKHLGDTVHSYDDDPEVEVDDIKVRQDTTLGLAISPVIGRFQHLHWVIEAQKLEQKPVPAYKKISTGIEYSLGSAADSTTAVALRLGYKASGASAGLLLNFGLVGFELSSEAVDIGAGNNRLIQRRNVGTFIVNAASL